MLDLDFTTPKAVKPDYRSPKALAYVPKQGKAWYKARMCGKVKPLPTREEGIAWAMARGCYKGTPGYETDKPAVVEKVKAVYGATYPSIEAIKELARPCGKKFPLSTIAVSKVEIGYVLHFGTCAPFAGEMAGIGKYDPWHFNDEEPVWHSVTKMAEKHSENEETFDLPKGAQFFGRVNGRLVAWYHNGESNVVLWEGIASGAATWDWIIDLANMAPQVRKVRGKVTVWLGMGMLQAGIMQLPSGEEWIVVPTNPNPTHGDALELP